MRRDKDIRAGEIMRRMRVIRGWTQQDLADRAGLGYSTVVNLEISEGRDPTERTCQKLDGAFGLLEGTFYKFVLRDKRSRIDRELVGSEVK